MLHSHAAYATPLPAAFLASTRVIDAAVPFCHYGSMKTSVDIPREMLEEAMRMTGAKTKREAIVTAVADFNRRTRMAALARHLGTCDDLISPAELADLRASS